ncbi:protein FAR1-RELATED SEQUENCE 5-like [Asparagus officinalis]|uniref:protein FAR1-RELATED SEQUENCE 5-like n=1 Tax=Asparagus officinalis TaxID=4686 RepID=UPI00098DEE3A|nr:protein FAR1-RELATED SEQUENCE 5-like [Asparagus officinalis]
MEETNSTSVEFGIGESSAIGSEIADNTVNAPKPLLGMKFNSYEEGYNYYNSYALLMGFGIRKSTVKYSCKTREVVDRKFVCDKEGYRPKRDKIENLVRRETRVGFCEKKVCLLPLFLVSSMQLMEEKSATTNDPEFYFAIEVDSSGQMRSVFWADGRSRASYLKFSDVIVFDVTYRTNKFSLLNIGAIITDQDRAMCNVIHSVFPTTRHSYCYWHMQKHIIDHLPTLVSRYGEQFQRYWGLWCNSSSIEQCEGYWVEMKEKFDINEEGEGWLQTTQLHEFVTQYEKAVSHCRLSEAHEDFKSLNTKPVMLLGHPIEVQGGEMYTRNMFDVFQTKFKGFGTEFCEELRKDGDIVEYKVCKFTDRGKWEVVIYEQSSQMQFRCTCVLFETNGVITVHDPDRAARTKGRPRNATRIQSSLEQAQEKKERMKHIVADVVNSGIIELVLNENWSEFLSTTCMDLWKMKFSLLHEVSMQKWEATWKCRLDLKTGNVCLNRNIYGFEFILQLGFNA